MQIFQQKTAKTGKNPLNCALFVINSTPYFIIMQLDNKISCVDDKIREIIPSFVKGRHPGIDFLEMALFRHCGNTAIYGIYTLALLGKTKSVAKKGI